MAQPALKNLPQTLGCWITCLVHGSPFQLRPEAILALTAIDVKLEIDRFVQIFATCVFDLKLIWSLNCECMLAAVVHFYLHFLTADVFRLSFCLYHSKRQTVRKNKLLVYLCIVCCFMFYYRTKLQTSVLFRSFLQFMLMLVYGQNRLINEKQSR